MSSPSPGESSLYTNPCSIVASADLFGMGIRVSLYLQWYTTVLAYLYDPDLATECTAVNYCFSIAVAIASLVHPHAIYAHEVIIIAMMLLVPPMIILVALADNFISVYRPAKTEKATKPEALAVPGAGAREKVDPNDPGGPVNAGDPDWRAAAGTGDPAAYPPPNRPPVKPHGPADWLREFAVVVSTTFLLVVSVWEFFIGVKKAQKADACHALFIYSHYLAGRYERLLKTVSIMSCIFTPLALGFLIYLRTIPGAEATHLMERSDTDAAEPKRKWRDRLISIESPYSPFRSDSHLIGPIKVRNVVAFTWGVMISFVIAQTETIIKQNQLQGVMDPSETGQLIPLTIGVCQFGLVTYKTWVKGKHTDEPGVRNLQKDWRSSREWMKRRTTSGERVPRNNVI